MLHSNSIAAYWDHQCALQILRDPNSIRACSGAIGHEESTTNSGRSAGDHVAQSIHDRQPDPHRADRAYRGVTMGVIGVAIAQSILAGIGFEVFGVPAAALWAFICLGLIFGAVVLVIAYDLLVAWIEEIA